MALGRQARILTSAQQAAALVHVATGRYPKRDRVILLLSYRAGLRAKEIACVLWRMVRAGDGRIAADISLENMASKGRTGGRVIPMHDSLREALVDIDSGQGPAIPIIRSQKGGPMAAGSIVEFFGDLYAELGFVGCSSHSGRRTLLTLAARQITQHRGSLRDVQGLAGHASITTTQRYIDESAEAKRAFIDSL